MHFDSMSNRQSKAYQAVRTTAEFCAAILLVGVYLLMFLWPLAAALWITSNLTMLTPSVQMVSLVVLYVVLSAVSIGIGEYVGLLDMENADGRVPPRRRWH